MTTLESSFATRFKRPPDLITSAPGRVNLIGEHTDYNGGFVLPTAIASRTEVAIARRDDSRVSLASAQFADGQVSSYSLGQESKTHDWTDYVKGVTQVLGARGAVIEGADIFVRSNIPLGSGLSSSAALTVAVTRAFAQIFTVKLTDVETAQIAHAAEHDFVGAPVGNMDPMACAIADVRSALFLDTRSLVFERIPMPDDADIVVIDSGVTHDHATGEYKTRRLECEKACGLLGVALLRDVQGRGIEIASRLPPPLDRRVRHVISENQRVLNSVAAMKAGDVEALGLLFDASHASMRDDYEVSVPAVDRLVECARVQHATLGARMTGGGFGGSIVVLVRRGEGARVGEATLEAYRSDGRFRGSIVAGELLQ